MEGAHSMYNKQYILCSRACATVDYSREHVTRLCREGKVLARFVDGAWYVNLDSLVQYKKAIETGDGYPPSSFQNDTDNLSAEIQQEVSTEKTKQKNTITHNHDHDEWEEMLFLNT